MCVWNSNNPSPNDNFVIVQKTSSLNYVIYWTESKNWWINEWSNKPAIVVGNGSSLPATDCSNIAPEDRADSSLFSSVSSHRCTTTNTSSYYFLHGSTHDGLVDDDWKTLSASSNTETIYY